jgi:hypothetical protein
LPCASSSAISPSTRSSQKTSNMFIIFNKNYLGSFTKSILFQFRSNYWCRVVTSRTTIKLEFYPSNRIFNWHEYSKIDRDLWILKTLTEKSELWAHHGRPRGDGTSGSSNTSSPLNNASMEVHSRSLSGDELAPRPHPELPPSSSSMAVSSDEEQHRCRRKHHDELVELSIDLAAVTSREVGNVSGREDSFEQVGSNCIGLFVGCSYIFVSSSIAKIFLYNIQCKIKKHIIIWFKICANCKNKLIIWLN